MDYRLQVFWNADVPDGRAHTVSDEIRALGIDTLESAQVSDLYFIRGDLTDEQVGILCRELLVDPIVQDVHITHSGALLSRGRSTPEAISAADLEVAHLHCTRSAVQVSSPRSLLATTVTHTGSLRAKRSNLLNLA